MARNRLEMLEEEEAQLQAERDRFQELADQYRQQGHLPPGGDQSWREREAERRAVYDRGYTPPQSDQTRREREAMLFAPAGEDHGAAAPGGGHEMEEPVLRPAPAARNGQGGTILIFILVAAIGLGIAVLAYPEMLTAAYWRAAQNNPAPPAPRAIQSPASPAIGPATTSSELPPPAPVPDLKNVLPAAPPVQEAPPPSVPVIDARPPAESAPEPKPVISGPRASARDNRGAGGFYAKAPGPDGVMRDTYFPADPKMDPPARQTPAKPDADGFYAKVPGPDGGLEMKFFPSKPPPR